jgi:opacity protein-like surface antigen
MRCRFLALAAFLALTVSPAVASAQAPLPPPDWTISLPGRVWVASGSTHWNFASAGIDPITDVHWRGVDGVLGEVAVDVLWKRIVWMASVGGTKIDDGALIESQYGKTDRQNRFSLTRSPVEEGHVIYVNNDIGFRVLQWRDGMFGAPATPTAGGYLDAFLGYQFWREEYTAFGVQGSLFLPGGLVVNQAEPRSTKVLTHRYDRHSIRLGARGQVPIIGALSLKAMAAISPYTHTEVEATQFLQTDIKAPTISSANGGFGYQLEAGLAYGVWRGLSIETGFRYWNFDSGSGDVTTTSVNGIVSKDKLNEAHTERYGPYFGLAWKF